MEEAANLRQLRISKNLTQAKAARFCGVTANTWARWERGEIKPGGSARKLIAMMGSRKFDPRALEMTRLLFETKPKRKRRDRGKVVNIKAEAVEASPAGSIVVRARRPPDRRRPGGR